VACQLFGLDHTPLIGSNLHDFLKFKNEDHESLPESHLEPTGEILQISGKVVNIYLNFSFKSIHVFALALSKLVLEFSSIL